MALPAILGAGALAGLIGKMFEKVVDVFFSRLAKRIAILTVVIAALYAATLTLLNFASAQIDSVLTGMPPEVSQLGAFFPSNIGACVSAIVATEIACLTYNLTIKALEMKTRVA